MATELISASATNTYNDGPSNFLVGSVVTMGPTQDIMDQMTASTFDTFMGMTHVNCLLCHNGRGHLDAVNLWATQTTRYQAWQLASYMSRTSTARTPVDPSNNNIYYWSLLNNQKNFTTDYTLNTTTGNRPARIAPGGLQGRAALLHGAAAVHPERHVAEARRGLSHRSGAQHYRRCPVRARHGELPVGLLLRPRASWTRRTRSTRRGSTRTIRRPPRGRCSRVMRGLLNALAQHFIDSNYNVKAMMREIVNSDTYQLSSALSRTVERRLGALLRAQVRAPPVGRGNHRRHRAIERQPALHDASVGRLYCSGLHRDRLDRTRAWARPSYAMQFPDVINTEGTTNAFLDSFLRGNRDDQPRR